MTLRKLVDKAPAEGPAVEGHGARTAARDAGGDDHAAVEAQRARRAGILRNVHRGIANREARTGDGHGARAALANVNRVDGVDRAAGKVQDAGIAPGGGQGKVVA